MEQNNKRCKNCGEIWVEEQQKCWNCKSWDFVIQDQFDILAEEVRGILALWDQGLLKKLDFQQMVSGAVSRCREANWSDGLGPNAFKTK